MKLITKPLFKKFINKTLKYANYHIAKTDELSFPIIKSTQSSLPIFKIFLQVPYANRSLYFHFTDSKIWIKVNEFDYSQITFVINNKFMYGLEFHDTKDRIYNIMDFDQLQRLTNYFMKDTLAERFNNEKI